MTVNPIPDFFRHFIEMGRHDGAVGFNPDILYKF